MNREPAQANQRTAPPKGARTAVAPDVSWSCNVADVPEAGLTVGTPFSLKCAGTALADFNATSFSLELAKPDKFRLRILENRKSTNAGVDLVVTSYLPGETNLKDAILTDGTNRIALEGISFSVKSVIPQGEPPKPFPPEAPVSLAWPLSVYVIAGAVLATLVGVISFLIQRSRRRRKFKAWLAANRTPLSAFDQLNKELRLVMKERDPVLHLAALELSTRTYLSRFFERPLLTSGAGEIFKTIQRDLKLKDERVIRKLRPLTTRLFGEFHRVKVAFGKTGFDPKEALNATLPQIHELAREFAQTIDNQKATRAPGKKRGSA